MSPLQIARKAHRDAHREPQPSNFPPMTNQTKSTASHTPGPWELGRGYSSTNSTPVRDVSGINVAWVCGKDSDMQRTKETTLANARLIAAAPELLAALENAANGFALLASNIRNHNQSAPKGGWLNVAADMANDMERHARAFINATTGGNQ